MMDAEFPVVTEEDVRRIVRGMTFDGAMRYYRENQVRSAEVGGGSLSADVFAGFSTPYRVMIDLQEDGLAVRCTCSPRVPCEHIGAVLLAWAHAPDSFTRVERPADAGFGGAAAVPDVSLPKAVPAQSAQTAETDHLQLMELLNAQTVATLRAIARARGFRVKGNLKDMIVAQMAEHLADPASIRAALDGLSPDTFLVLESLYCLTASGPGLMPAEAGEVLSRLSGKQTPPQSALEHLAGLALVLPIYDPYSGIVRYVAPRILGPHLPPSQRLLPEYERDAARLRAESPGDGLAWPATLYLSWQHLREHRARLRRVAPRTLAERMNRSLGGWPVVAAEVAKFADSPGWQYGRTALTVPPFEPELDDATLDALRAFIPGERDRADLAYHLLRALNALQVGRAGVEVREDAMLAFLRLGSIDQVKAVFDAWLRLDTWSELNLTLRNSTGLRLKRRAAYNQFTVQDLLTALVHARQFVVSVLRRAAAGRWVSLEGFLHVVWSLNPGFLHPRLPYEMSEPIWWLERELRPQDASSKSESDWAAGPGRYVVELLRGPLRWLGLVDLGYARDELVAFRLTPLGAHLLGQPSTFTVEQAGPPLHIAPDLEVRVAPGAGSDIHATLGRVAKLEAAGVGGFRYRLSRPNLHAAFDGGLALDRLLEWLEVNTGGPLPRPVADTLAGWWRRYAQVRLYPGLTVIELADDYTLPELLAKTSLRRSIVYTVSPRLAVIRSEDAEALMAELIARGYTPKLQEGPA